MYTTFTPEATTSHTQAGSMSTETVRVTVDTVAFAIEQGALEVLLIKRKFDPFKSSWALPGGFIVDADKSLDDAAARELIEEMNVGDVYLE